jgi:transcriptional regulator with XRE-family HTH domain
MSRQISNRGLRSLCAKRETNLDDLACACNVNRKSVHKYLSGRHSPRLETRMAEFFKLSVPQLRRKLGLQTAQQQATRRTTADDRLTRRKAEKGSSRD